MGITQKNTRPQYCESRRKRKEPPEINPAALFFLWLAPTEYPSITQHDAVVLHRTQFPEPLAAIQLKFGQSLISLVAGDLQLLLQYDGRFFATCCSVATTQPACQRRRRDLRAHEQQQFSVSGSTQSRCSYPVMKR
jgi:hypothetical protein